MRDRDFNVQSTYRYLRLAMPLLVLVLATSVVLQIFAPEPDCWQSSISAYYYTAARAVFVSTLCAVGTCMIVYQGNTDAEDIALNVSGFLAFVVAFVPTTVDTTCRASNVPLPEELAAAVRNNVTALLVGGGVVVATAWLIRRLSPSTPTKGPLAKWPLVATSVALGVGAVIFFSWPDAVLDHGHYVAAVTLFVGVVVVVWMNTRGYSKQDAEAAPPARRYSRLYTAVLVAMIGSFVVIVGAGQALDGFREWIFWVEAALIIEFAVFWVIQTVELWNVRDRGQLRPRQREALEAAD